MEFIFYAIAFVVIVSVIAGFVQTVMYPPLELQPADLPEVIQTELRNLFPSFVPQKIELRRPRNRYVMPGSIAGKVCQVIVDLTPDDDLAELEFSGRSGAFNFTNKSAIASAAVPKQIADVMNPFLAGDETRMESSQAYAGMIGTETGYKIKVDSEVFEYGFEITASGRLVKFEKEHRHH